jgi:hypothetical protein
MVIYIFAIIVAVLLQIGTIYFLRGNFWAGFLYATPFILAYQFLFLWSYSSAPRFIVVWFITTVLTNSLAFLAGYFLWHERVSTLNIAGITLILVGIFFLQMK